MNELLIFSYYIPLSIWWYQGEINRKGPSLFPLDKCKKYANVVDTNKKILSSFRLHRVTFHIVYHHMIFSMFNAGKYIYPTWDNGSLKATRTSLMWMIEMENRTFDVSIYAVVSIATNCIKVPIPDLSKCYKHFHVSFSSTRWFVCGKFDFQTFVRENTTTM